MMNKPELTYEQAWGCDNLMVLAAFRYCLGRQTYIVSECADWLISIWSLLDENTQKNIQRDLEEKFQLDDAARLSNHNYKPLGMDCDRADWQRVRALWRKQAQ